MLGPAKSTTIVDVLANAGQDDLDAIDDRISELSRELETLKTARRVIAVRISGPQKRQSKPRQPKAGTNDNGNGSSGKVGSPIAEAIYDLIAKEGSMPIAVIARKLAMAPQGVGSAVSRSGWFVRTTEGDVDIAKA